MFIPCPYRCPYQHPVPLREPVYSPPTSGFDMPISLPPGRTPISWAIEQYDMKFQRSIANVHANWREVERVNQLCLEWQEEQKVLKAKADAELAEKRRQVEKRQQEERQAELDRQYERDKALRADPNFSVVTKRYAETVLLERFVRQLIQASLYGPEKEVMTFTTKSQLYWEGRELIYDQSSRDRMDVTSQCIQELARTLSSTYTPYFQEIKVSRESLVIKASALPNLRQLSEQMNSWETFTPDVHRSLQREMNVGLREIGYIKQRVVARVLRKLETTARKQPTQNSVSVTLHPDWETKYIHALRSAQFSLAQEPHYIQTTFKGSSLTVRMPTSYTYPGSTHDAIFKIRNRKNEAKKAKLEKKQAEDELRQDQKARATASDFFKAQRDEPSFKPFKKTYWISAVPFRSEDSREVAMRVTKILRQEPYSIRCYARSGKGCVTIKRPRQDDEIPSSLTPKQGERVERKARRIVSQFVKAQKTVPEEKLFFQRYSAAKCTWVRNDSPLVALRVNTMLRDQHRLDVKTQSDGGYVTIERRAKTNKYFTRLSLS